MTNSGAHKGDYFHYLLFNDSAIYKMKTVGFAEFLQPVVQAVYSYSYYKLTFQIFVSWLRASCHLYTPLRIPLLTYSAIRQNLKRWRASVGGGRTIPGGGGEWRQGETGQGQCLESPNAFVSISKMELVVCTLMNGVPPIINDFRIEHI